MIRPVETEWTDKFGTHYEVRALGRDGKIHSQKITKQLTGWSGREEAFNAVKVAANRTPTNETNHG